MRLADPSGRFTGDIMPHKARIVGQRKQQPLRRSSLPIGGPPLKAPLPIFVSIRLGGNTARAIQNAVAVDNPGKAVSRAALRRISHKTRTVAQRRLTIGRIQAKLGRRSPIPASTARNSCDILPRELSPALDDPTLLSATGCWRNSVGSADGEASVLGCWISSSSMIVGIACVDKARSIEAIPSLPENRQSRLSIAVDCRA